MNYKTIAFLLFIVFGVFVLLMTVLQLKTTKKELLRSIYIVTPFSVPVLIFLLYAFHAASLQPGNQIYWTTEAIAAVFSYWFVILWVMPIYTLLQKYAFPRFHEYYGIKKSEFRKLNIFNEKKLEKVWEENRKINMRNK